MTLNCVFYSQTYNKRLKIGALNNRKSVYVFVIGCQQNHKGLRFEIYEMHVF